MPIAVCLPAVRVATEAVKMNSHSSGDMLELKNTLELAHAAELHIMGEKAATELETEKAKNKAKGFPDRVTKKWLENELLAKYAAATGAATIRRHKLIPKEDYTHVSTELTNVSPCFFLASEIPQASATLTPFFARLIC